MSKNIPFIPTPIEILENAKITSDEKVLYLSMLNTYKLSFINGDDWKDSNGIFIYYSIPRIQKSIGCSRPKAIKILNLLEKNSYIVKEHQDGKSTKIYLVENEYTEFVLQGMENYKNNKKHKKIAPRKIAKQEEVTESNNMVGVVEEVTNTEPEVKAVPVADYTGNQSIFDVFKAIIGREPDNSFKKCMARRAREMNITAENIRGIIELARKARNPEAYILTLTKPNAEQQSTYQQAQQQPKPAQDAPLDEYELEWLISREEIKKNNGQEYSQARINELEQMLEVINQKKAEEEEEEEDAKRPLEDWELDFLEDFHRRSKQYEEESSNVSNLDTSQVTHTEDCK